jgi:hypothetical protein
MSPILKEQVYTFTRLFATHKVNDEKSVAGIRVEECALALPVEIDLHILLEKQEFYMDMCNAFDVNKHLVIFRGGNLMGNVMENSRQLVQFFDWLAEIVDFANKKFKEYNKSESKNQLGPYVEPNKKEKNESKVFKKVLFTNDVDDQVDEKIITPSFVRGETLIGVIPETSHGTFPSELITFVVDGIHKYIDGDVLIARPGFNSKFLTIGKHKYMTFNKSDCRVLTREEWGAWEALKSTSQFLRPKHN